MDPLVALGASGAPNLRDALRTSPKIIICIDNYNATLMLLDQPRVPPLLGDRTVIQLSTGTPREVADSDIFFREDGATYLDGAIMVYPDTIRTADAQILVAGPEAAFQNCRTMFQCLAGDLRYLGPNIRAAATLDLALLSRLEGMVFGTIHGAHICEAEGVSLEQLAALYAEGNRARTLTQAIHDDVFEVGGISATVDVAAGVMARL